MTAGVSLDELVRSGARSFLQTVLVIDNELVMAAPPVEPAPRLPPRPPGPFGRGPVAEPSQPAAVEPERTAEGRVDTPVAATAAGPSRLNVKSIMDAFLKKSLICGMHRPEGEGDLVSEAINAARRSDAVIIDWLLVGSDPGPAKDIIKGILDGDREDHGRLRLIVVYTSMPGVEAVAREVSGHLGGTALKHEGNGVLTGADTRIVVLNKSGTPMAAETVAVPDLPERIIAEFARLSDGILSTFAVTAVAAIRRATHHVLAVFSSELDGAFLAHRCSLKTPDDATEFALELLAGEFRGVVTRNGEAMQVLASAPLMEWIDRRAGADRLIRTDEVQVPVDVVKAFASGGEEAVLASEKVQDHAVVPGRAKPREGLGKRKISPRTVGQLFHDGHAHYLRSHHGFSRLSQFKNEPYGRRAPRGRWKPTLSLGSLIVALDKTGAPVPGGYLLCTQPRCDSIRIGDGRSFPFQTGRAVTDDAFNLVATLPAPGDAEERVHLLVEMKPFNTVMVRFNASSDERVLAEAQGPSFVFTDADGGRYLWLGDLRDLTAQRTAGTVAARLHDVGIDEFEWLRLHAKIVPPKPGNGAKAAAAPAEVKGRGADEGGGG
ncbi:hypothetical protein A3862_20905 [Methylobacterium sp. XJLW]|uniref:response regulator receiver domain n=1 Tax=Methylobacterium sp. XJLW TaxID=739141 RepID=UPI000DAAE623|nr:response regulator receiver domain [Methylobacterium sp. XJLW]AWV17657.1 hypothetical protein A3862_20905 [Methylobacterium sp. XJLW]